MRAKGHYFIEYPHRYQEEVTLGNIKLFKDTSFRPEWNLILHGTVVSTPPFEVSEIQPGDKIYFQYLVAQGDEEIYEEGGKQYLRVPEDLVFCYVRDGEIKTSGEYVLCRAVYDEGTEEVEVDGKKMKVKMSGSLVTDIDIKYDKRHTRIHTIGETDLEIGEGDVVIMDKYCDEKYEIEGTEYFVMKQRDILCKVL